MERKQKKQAEMMLAQGYMAAAEAAEKTGYHISSIYRMIDSEAVEGKRFGRGRYVKIASLKAYLGDAASMITLPEQTAPAAAPATPPAPTTTGRRRAAPAAPAPAPATATEPATPPVRRRRVSPT